MAIPFARMARSYIAGMASPHSMARSYIAGMARSYSTTVSATSIPSSTKSSLKR
jgi:hypothetical protein